jgi:beta-N-acetylhexosaminidase
MVFGFCGTSITPDVVELIKKYHLGGLRISQRLRCLTIFNDIKPGEQPDESTRRSLVKPYGKNRDCSLIKNCTSVTADEYADALNRLRTHALERELGIPLHFTVDQEGNGNDDMLCGQRLFPGPMGLASSGDTDLAYRAALATGMQLKALGVNMMHSPCLDVNTNPNNPEIANRAYSDNPADVTKYALATLKGLQETGIIATGKHFPGRGESEADAHWGLPSVNLDRETLLREHVAPYRELIKAGLPAIMLAHSCFPALGVTGIPAGMSKDLIHNFLRGELGFDGVITTDNMIMGGILKQYEMSDAIVEVLAAGCNLVLMRDESPIRIKIIEKVLDAVKTGRLAENTIDDSVKRVLGMRWDMGITENGGIVEPSTAASILNDKFIVNTAAQAAKKCIIVLRDKDKLLPIKPEQKVLLVEQIYHTHWEANNCYCHPGMLWEAMCELSENVNSVEIATTPSNEDIERVRSRLNEADTVVFTNYYNHKSPSNYNEFIGELYKMGKKVILISNTVYELTNPPEISTVIVVGTPAGCENLKTAAELLYGKINASAKLPLKNVP